ncbi:MAG: MOSC domain-containing protein [Planctomycetota bacterium]
MRGAVVNLWIQERAAAPMTGVPRARAVANHGFEGCLHARPGKKRQVLLIDAETLDSFGIEPGRAKENVTTRGIAIQDLPGGSRVRLGTAVLEITGPCEPCGFMDSIRPGLREATIGKRGVLARVVEAGTVLIGDEVSVEGA